MEQHSMMHDVKIETTTATTAIAGSAWYAYTLNELVALCTLVFIVLQMAFLMRKWYLMESDRRKKKNESSN